MKSLVVIVIVACAGSAFSQDKYQKSSSKKKTDKLKTLPNEEAFCFQ